MDFRIRVNKHFEFFYQRRSIAYRRMSMIAHPLASRRRLEQVSLANSRALVPVTSSGIASGLVLAELRLVVAVLTA
jgi:hypothetical protein